MHTIYKVCGGMGGVVHEEQGAMIATHRTHEIRAIIRNQMS